ncbi:hypothetical protein [Neomegalonema sp.]|uniref:hypothetical protein n=1 Tax=Neomegalonema sp. TaxID=2039713 RepID=UPI00261B0A73|nr:hypothetical protein [Neomegalonema sp.]MDD2867467.1 hypothetical protein [Neomegalonema sp.]
MPHPQTPAAPPAQPEPAYEIVLRRGPAPGTVLRGGLRALNALAGAASSVLGGLYAQGARAVSDRKERLEDEFAARSARSRPEAEDSDG